MGKGSVPYYLLFFLVAFIMGVLLAVYVLEPIRADWPAACSSENSWVECKQFLDEMDEEFRAHRCAHGVLRFEGAQLGEVKLCRDGQNPVWVSHSGVRMELDWLGVEP